VLRGVAIRFVEADTGEMRPDKGGAFEMRFDEGGVF
jgi:hypothetical protein